MIVADTSIWIEFFKVRGEVHSKMLFELKQNNILAVEFVFGELLQVALNKKEIEIIRAYWNNLPQAAVPGLWIDAGLHASKHKTFAKGVGIVDVAIYLSAKVHGAKLWTLDKKLNGILKRNEMAFPS